MKILVNDHAGHPFQIQLSRHLAYRGHNVLHTFTKDLQTPRGNLQLRQTDPKTLNIEPIVLPRTFNRYGLVQRFLQEKELGRLLKEKVNSSKPNVVISANTPLGAQAKLLSACQSTYSTFIFWLQDLLGYGIKNNLKKKLPLLGYMIGKYYINLEVRMLKKSAAVVAITEDFVPVCKNAGVIGSRIHVIHNWAPLHEMPIKEKENDWSCMKGLEKTFNFIYSGTLGMKHNPDLLVKLAKKFSHIKNVRVVVISEGLGAEYLAKQKQDQRIGNLILLPFQPFEKIPEVQATADILVAILESDAGVFAVPSKVLTYLCACRPLLLAVPLENLSARIVAKHKAGITVAPDDIMGFTQQAENLYQNHDLRKTLSENGRRYAEKAFDIEKITDKFERIIQAATSLSSKD